MKAVRSGWRALRHDQLVQEVVHDSYKQRRKLPEPTRCPGCGALWRAGRWTWGRASAGAHAALCPACRRARDRFPAGYVLLRGRFFREHRNDILALATHCEASERAEHPLERIIATEPARGGGVCVTTASVHLARRIAEAVFKAYKGELKLRYNPEERLFRATWRRDD
jgi:NMD protein affecting ribosome stability and mRNA decay